MQQIFGFVKKHEVFDNLTLMYSKKNKNQFEEVQKKSQSGKEFTTAVADFIHKRAAIEKEYAKKLQQLCKSTAAEQG